MNKYPSFKADNPFASQSKLFAHIDRIYDYTTLGDTDPLFMEVNLTNRCNLNCSWCISGNFDRNDVELDLEHFRGFVIDFVYMGGRALTFSGGGEPTLHSQFIELMEWAKKEGLDLGLMTNGAFNYEYCTDIGANFDWVRISLDTLNPQLYKEWKGVNKLDLVLQNVEYLAKCETKLGINVNVGMHHTVDDVKDTIIQLYDDVAYIQFRPVLPRYYLEENIELNEEVWEYLSRYKNDSKINLSLDKLKDLRYGYVFPFDNCVAHMLNPVLDANGDLLVCMYHPGDSNFVLGNIYTHTLQEIWYGEQRTNVREYLQTVDYPKKCQMCCKLAELNKFFAFLKGAAEIEDKNFL